MRRPLPAPPGVIEQVAPPLPPESWDGGRTGVETQSLGESVVEGIFRRTGETKNNTLDTLDKVETLRKETREDISNVNSKVDALVEVVVDLRVDVAKQGGQNEVIITMLEEQRRAREQSGAWRLTSATAELGVDLEVKKTRQLTEIGERAKWGETWRGITFKIVAGIILALGALGSAYLLGRH
ncbi:MAG: hypothetical protein H0U52_06865 [Chloroflexi bacterium]|nr:hypothetical protein [Chloroflexota bacterium]